MVFTNLDHFGFNMMAIVKNVRTSVAKMTPLGKIKQGRNYTFDGAEFSVLGFFT